MPLTVSLIWIWKAGVLQRVRLLDGQLLPVSFILANFCTGRSKNLRFSIRLPLLSRRMSAMASRTERSLPSEPCIASETRANCHLLRGVSSSLMITTSPTPRSLRGQHHFACVWRFSRYSFLHRDQNLLARCCTRRQRLLEYLSASWKPCLEGGRTIFDFIVKRWLGVKGNSEYGSMRHQSVHHHTAIVYWKHIIIRFFPFRYALFISISWNLLAFKLKMRKFFSDMIGCIKIMMKLSRDSLLSPYLSTGGGGGSVLPTCRYSIVTAWQAKWCVQAV